MGKKTGFLEWKRQASDCRPTAERTQNFKEFTLPRSAEIQQQQGGRCMDCGVPFCQQGCPLGNPIPDFNHAVFTNNWKRAYTLLKSTNSFPEFTGRLCPAPCEAACVLNINQDPVTIEQNEKEIIEHAFRSGWVVPEPPAARTGKRVAIVGSGPAGLAAAEQLNRAGHEVTVFEKDDQVGGLIRYGIPDFKIEKWVIDRRLDIMMASGIKFRIGIEVGKDISFSDLTAEFDATLLAIGAGRPRDLAVPGRHLSGVHFAMTYLTEQNRRVSGHSSARPPIHAKDKRVIVLGGGDTGSDCVGTANRQGARSIHQLELMPAPPGVRNRENPWPQWPLIMRTSSSHKEGGERAFAVMTTQLTGRNDNSATCMLSRFGRSSSHTASEGS